MKILHVIASLGSGGAERQLSLLAPALAREGVNTHVAFCHGGSNLERLQKSNVGLHALKAAGNHNPILAWQLYKLVRDLRPDIVQTWLLQMDVLGGAAALLSRIPLIISERSSAALYPPGWKARARIHIGSHASAIVANSNGGTAYWRPHVAASKLILIRNCVTPIVEQTTFPQICISTQYGARPLVMFAGRLSFEKNISNMVASLILVAQTLSAVTIIVFGEGPQREDVVNRVAVAGLSQRILIAGYTPHLAAWMARADVLISVSHFEGHPNVVMEAAAARCPMVLSDISAHRELFDDDSVAFAPADSPSEIARAILSALQNRAIAVQRADRAHLIASKYDLPSTVSAYLLTYKKVLAAFN